LIYRRKKVSERREAAAAAPHPQVSRRRIAPSPHPQHTLYSDRIVMQQSSDAVEYTPASRRYHTRAGPSPRMPPAERPAALRGASKWHPGLHKVHTEGTLSKAARLMAPWHAETLAREHFFAEKTGSSTGRAGGKGGRGGDHGSGESMSGCVARSLLFSNESWDTIQSVRVSASVGGGRREERVVEYVLGRPWQCSACSLDPSTAFLLSQSRRHGDGAGVAQRRQLVLSVASDQSARHSFYLLFLYKSIKTDAEGAVQILTQRLLSILAVMSQGPGL
jgi:hypothetical protein